MRRITKPALLAKSFLSTLLPTEFGKESFDAGSTSHHHSAIRSTTPST
jgi:hypothetical protein